MISENNTSTNPERNNKQSLVRLDKWLWAARFFKTRAIARQAIDGGKVELEGVRAKPGKNIQLGMKVKIRLGYDIREVKVTRAIDKRGPAKEAQKLYQETTESLERRETASRQRKLAAQVIQYDQKRPEKHQRRKMQQFKRNQ